MPRHLFALLGLCGALLGACSAENAQKSAAPQLSVEQIRAIEALRPADVKLAAKYSRSCFMCHTSPDAKAPLTHSDEWQARVQAKGMDGLLNSAKNGLNAMPPMGQCADCSDAELKALIAFMSRQNPH